jgi:L-2-hydroxyglutarate oxidase LhgO
METGDEIKAKGRTGAPEATSAFDVAVIGAGLLGCFAAWHLARAGMRTLVIERNGDVATGISKANTSIVYSGADIKPGTLKARLCVEGNDGFARLCAGLNVRFLRQGSLMLAFGPVGLQVLQDKLAQGRKNHVRGLELLGPDEAWDMEPHVSASIAGALWAPSTGTVNPWELCLAAAEAAAENGAVFWFESDVTRIAALAQKPAGPPMGPKRYAVSCSNGRQAHALAVVNCAGLAAHRMSEMVAPVSFRLRPSRGDYIVLDESVSGHVRHIIFHESEHRKKTATIVPTVDGNLLIGPSSLDGEDCSEQGAYPQAFATARAGLEFCRSSAAEAFPDLPCLEPIRSFATARPNIFWAHRDDATGLVSVSDKSIHDLHIAAAPGNPGFVNVAGVKTPGLTCADGIGRHVAGLVQEYFAAVGQLPMGGRGAQAGAGPLAMAAPTGPAQPQASPAGTAPVRAAARPVAPVQAAARPVAQPRRGDGRIVCRCRQVTDMEVRESLRGRLPGSGASIDAVKRRCGCGMGRCQGAFCTERIVDIICEETGCDPCDVLKGERGSQLVLSQFEPPGASKRTEPPLLPASVALTVIGAGAAGIAAALAAVDCGIPASDILVIDRLDGPGGILPQCLHTGFGMRAHKGGLTGPEFLAPLLARLNLSGIRVACGCTALRFLPDADVEADSAAGGCAGDAGGCAGDAGGGAGDADLGVGSCTGGRTDRHRLLVATPTGRSIVTSRCVVLATGARERSIGSLPVAGTRPSGVFSAGAAQRMANLRGWRIGRRVVVLGSGNVGMIMAARMAELGCEVPAVVEATSKHGGLKHNWRRFIRDAGIPLLLNSTITRLTGDTRLSAVEILTDDGSNPPVTQAISCDTLLVSVGMVPERDLLLTLSSAMRPASPCPPARTPSLEGAICGLPPWLFVAGNARKVYDFIEQVTDDGYAAGRAAGALIGECGL